MRRTLAFWASISLFLISCSGHHSDEQPEATAVEALAPVTACAIPAGASSLLEVPAGLDPTQATVVAFGTLTVGDRAQIRTPSDAAVDAYNLGPTGTSELGAQSRVGSLVSVPGVLLRNGAIVEGDVSTEGDISLQAGAVVSGTQENYLELPAPRELVWLDDFVDGPDTDVVLQNQTAESLAAGSFGTVHVHSGSTLTLAAGVYRMTSLKLEPGAVLALDDATGPVILHVESDIIWRGTLQGSSPQQNFLVLFGGTSFLALETSFQGTLIAPQASARFGVGGTQHSGSLFAKQIELDPDVVFTHVPFAHWDGLLHRQELSPTLPTGPVCDDDGEGCCPEGMDVAVLDRHDNVLGVDQTNVCILTGAGQDRVTALDRTRTEPIAVLGGPDEDLMQGAEGPDTLSGGEGDDTLLGRGGNDEVFGGAGDDFLCSGDGDDVLHGGEGDDAIQAGPGNDAAFPGPGRNVVVLGDGDDTVRFFAECELEGAEGSTFDPGEGTDTFISPVSLGELAARSIDVSAFEVVTVSPDPCSSKCGKPESSASYDLNLIDGTITASGTLACEDDDFTLEVLRKDGQWEVLAQSLAPHAGVTGAEGAQTYSWALTARVPYGPEYYTSSGPGRASIVVRVLGLGGHTPIPPYEFEMPCDDEFACCGQGASDVWERSMSHQLADQPREDDHRLANVVQGVAHDDDHWYFSKSENPDGFRDIASGLWAVPVSSDLVDFKGRTGVVNPWTNRFWNHPGGMDFDLRSGNLFVALQGSKTQALGVVPAEAVRGFSSGTVVDTDTEMPCSSLHALSQPSCYTVVRNPDGTSYEAWAHLIAEDMASYEDRMAWIAVDPRVVACSTGAPSCVRLYSVPFMNYEHTAPGFESLRDAPVYVDVYEWALLDGAEEERGSQALTFLGDESRIRVHGAAGHQLTAGYFGNGYYQGGKVSPAGKLYVVSDGRNNSERYNNRDSKSDNAVLVVDLPEVSAPGGAPSNVGTFVSTHRVNVDVGREELEDIALWDLDALRRVRPDVPTSMAGQVHVILVDQDDYTDNWYFKHVRLDEGCQPGSFKFWEGTYGSQDEVCTVSAISQHIDAHNGQLSCENDEAESVTMRYIPAGAKMWLYNDPDCDHSADWGELTVHEGIYIDELGYFDRDESNAAYSFEWHDVEPGSAPWWSVDPELWELGGKVSCIQIQVQ